MIGRRLSHYEIVAKLGEGGMGAVYKARDTRLDRLVAIKILSGAGLDDLDRRRRFIQEAKAASALNHPSVVTIHDIATEDDVDFMAMEYVEGRTLEQLIDRKALTRKMALDCAIQAAQALARAHAAGIIHRDLKPSNIMVTNSGLTKILDFGVAKLLATDDETDWDGAAATRTMAVDDRGLTAAGRIVGTVAYMSPEQATAQKVDARSDIFSFGAVLYEMFTGAVAFSGDSTLSTLHAVMQLDPRPPSALNPTIPNDLDRIILRCLRKDPARRFQHIGDVAVELEEVKLESSSQTLAVAPVGGASRRFLAMGSALALLVATGIAAWMWLTPNRPDALPLRHEQLTSFPGDEGFPTFSRDGTQVAFVWNGEMRDNTDIYIKYLGVDKVLRLTSDDADDRAPEWSPDGSHIAFVRRNGSRAALYVTAPVPGSERKLADLRAPIDADLGNVFALAQFGITWSGDSRWVLVPTETRDGSSGIVAFPVSSDEQRIVLSLGSERGRLHFPAVSHDGTQLAFVRCTGGACDLFVVALTSDLKAEGTPTQVARLEGGRILGLTWSQDDRSLLYGLWGAGLHVWRLSRDGGEAVRLELGGSAANPAVSRTGNKLAYARLSSDLDLWRFDSGGIPVPIASSTLNEMNPEFSPDGQRIVFVSERGGRGAELWVAKADGSSATRIVPTTGRFIGGPRWSPDGKLIAYDARRQDGSQGVFVVDAAGGPPREVFSPATVPTWSRDGKWLYFGSRRSDAGPRQVWRIPASGGASDARQMTTGGGRMGWESWDEQSLYFIRDGDSALYSKPLAGGPERKVIDSVVSYGFFPSKSGIYHIVQPDPLKPHSYELRLLSFASGQPARTRVLYQFESLGSTSLFTVSPDERTVIVDGISPSKNDDLMLIQNFR